MNRVVKFIVWGSKCEVVSAKLWRLLALLVRSERGILLALAGGVRRGFVSNFDLTTLRARNSSFHAQKCSKPCQKHDR